MFKNVNYTALAAVALIVSVPFLLDSTAQDARAPVAATTVAAAAPAAPSSPAPDFNDPAFDRYVDLLLLGQAWDTLDPVLLTDCAMQLAEGERILMRSHKAVSSTQLMDLAAKVAADKRDTATLDRLAKVYTSTKNNAALEQINTAKKLASASRKVDPAMSVSATETSPDQLALYQDALNGVKAAGLVGDASYFENLEEGLGNKQSILTNLTEAQRAHLKKIMGEARSSMPKDGDPALADTLSKLKDASRQNVAHGVGSIIHGIQDLRSGHNTGHGVGSIIHGIQDLQGNRGGYGGYNGGYGGYNGGYGGGYGGYNGGYGGYNGGYGGYGGHHGGYGGGYGHGGYNQGGYNHGGYGHQHGWRP